NKCGYSGEVIDNLIHLHRHDNTWDKCISEQEGWIEIHKRLGLYLDNPDHYFLPDGKPHLAERNKHLKEHLDKFLEIYDVKGKVILDLGAGIGWVSNLLALRGANVIALECNKDIFTGL